jgi:hypothetical protein
MTVLCEREIDRAAIFLRHMGTVGDPLAECLLKRSASLNPKIIRNSFRTSCNSETTSICKLLCEGLSAVVLKRRTTTPSATAWSV